MSSTNTVERDVEMPSGNNGVDAKTILLIDGDNNFREYFSELFCGTTVLSCGDGADGVLCARSMNPDLIVMDINMRNGDGFNVCSDLRGDPRTRAIPIVILTARTLEVDKIRGLEYGADDYVAKPFSIRELKARMNAVVRCYKD